MANRNRWPRSKCRMSASITCARVRTSSGSPRRRSRHTASMRGDRSSPTTSSPARAVGMRIRPVPQPISNTGLPLVLASSTKNPTSGRPRWSGSCSYRSAMNGCSSYPPPCAVADVSSVGSIGQSHQPPSAASGVTPSPRDVCRERPACVDLRNRSTNLHHSSERMLSRSHHIPQLRRVDVLLEPCHFAILDVPDVADLRVHAPAGRLVRPAVAGFNNDAVASVVE